MYHKINSSHQGILEEKTVLPYLIVRSKKI